MEFIWSPVTQETIGKYIFSKLLDNCFLFVKNIQIILYTTTVLYKNTNSTQTNSGRIYLFATPQF